MTSKAPLPQSGARSSASLGLFGREWIRSPLRVGAVAPSSAGLAAAITDGLADKGGPVIELGPGTGVFTGALLGHGIPAERIAAIEASDGFASALASRYPQIKVIGGDAARVRHLTPFGPAGAALIICGLPLLSMPPTKVLRIVSGSFAALRPGAEFRLFTYGLRCPVSKAIRARIGLSAHCIAFVALNMPPARVYVLKRQERGT
jgi:phospholipid N-methyltransferase